MWRMPKSSQEWDLLRGLSAAFAADSETDDDDDTEKHVPLTDGVPSSCMACFTDRMVLSTAGDVRSARCNAHRRRAQLRGANQPLPPTNLPPTTSFQSSWAHRLARTSVAASAANDGLPRRSRLERAARRQTVTQGRANLAVSESCGLGSSATSFAGLRPHVNPGEAAVANPVARATAPAAACDADVTTLAMCLESFACLDECGRHVTETLQA